MTISENAEQFFGKTVKNYDAKDALDQSGETVYRLSLDYDDARKMPDLIEEFLARVDKNTLDALVIGMWAEPYESDANSVLETLVKHADSLPALRAIFVGDITYEECEISWIVQGSYKPLLDAFPELEVLRIRGGNGLIIEPFKHDNLRELIIETGGLPSAIAKSLSTSHLPALEHLELWLGTEDYGFDGDVATYRTMLEDMHAPDIRYLGLRDSDIADELAAWLAASPFVSELDTLDLSLGTIGDAGAKALAESPHVAQLALLDLSHHYISDAWQKKLLALPIKVVLDDPQDAGEDGEDKYVAVGE